MNYLLDTDTLIYWLKGDKNIDRKIQENTPSVLYISVVSLAELYYGAYVSDEVQNNIENIETLKKQFRIIKIEESIAEEFGKIKADLRKRGVLFGDFDILIAAISKRYNFKLVTNNVEHYKRIGNIVIENWKKQ